MANSNLIKPKQIDASLIDFINQVTSSTIGNNIAQYASTGYQGANVLYITGGNQTVLGPTTFTLSPTVPYSGLLTQTINQQFVLDKVGILQTYLNNFTPTIVYTTGNQAIQGIKTLDSVLINQGISGSNLNFTNSALVPTINLASSPNVNSAINLNFFYNQSLVFTTGDQSIQGNKTYTLPINIPIATGTNQAVQFSQLMNSGAFLQQQIDGMLTASGNNLSGFGGVISFNGQSGNLFSIGRGNVTVTQQGNLTIVSGALPTITGSGTYLIQGAQGAMGLNLNPRGTWTSSITYAYLDLISFSGNAFVSTTGHLSSLSNMPGTGGSLAVAPWAFLLSGGGIPGPIGPQGTGLQGTSGISGPTGAWQFQGTYDPIINYRFNNAIYYNGSTYGFSGALSSGVLPTTGTNWYLIAQSGSQGLQGPSAAIFAWRGGWLSTGNYMSGDAVYYNGSSYTTQVSASGTTPGTGIPWGLFVSGATGPTGNTGGIGPQGIQGVIGSTGAWQYQGAFSFGAGYIFNNAASYSGTTYGYSGVSSIGFSPDTGINWYVIAKSGSIGPQGIQGIIGPIGNFINSGTITGNFTNLSFYFDYPFTGLYLSEAFISQKFTFTGYAIGCVSSGLGPAHLAFGYSGNPLFNLMTGNIYQRDLNNVVTEIAPFNFNSGLFSKVSGNFSVNVPALSRVGISLYSGLSGIKGLTFMVAGF